MRIIRFDNKGWRARFDAGFDEQNVARVADAFGYIWADARPGATVLVGYDTRFDGRRLAEVAGEVLASYGLRVIVSNAPCPTPALGWCTAQDDDAVGAVTLTASSASCEYGGISARGYDGGPISDEFYEAATQIVSSSPVRDRGVIELGDFMGPYLAHLRQAVDVEAIADFAPLVVVDPMYGAVRGYLANLLRSIGCRVTELHGTDDSDFGGLHPSPVEPWVDKCEQAVLQSKAALGLVFDSDGDRLALVDDTGRYVTPHRMVPLILEHLVRDRGASGRVVVTHSSSSYIHRQAKRLGCELTAVPVGFNRIYREFVEGDVILGAEEFGGVCVPQHMVERDGLFAALLVLEMLAVRRVALSDLLTELEQHVGTKHYIRRDIRLDAASIQSFRNILPGLYLQEVCGHKPTYVGHSDGLVLRFEDDSWLQLRASRTEPLVRANAEAANVRQAEQLIHAACDGALGLLNSR